MIRITFFSSYFTILFASEIRLLMLRAAKTIRLICEVWLPVLPLLSACFVLKRHRYALVLEGEQCDWVMLLLCYETVKRAAGDKKELFERDLN